MKLVFLAVVITLTGCLQNDGEWYSSSKLYVNCGAQFKGIVYAQSHTTAIRATRYKLANGNSIELPGGCVKIVLEEYEYKEGER